MEQLMEEYVAVWKRYQQEKKAGVVLDSTVKELHRLEDEINKLGKGVPR